MKYTKCIMVQACLALASFSGASLASTIIAHRGIYNDTNASRVLSENSTQAVERTAIEGLAGAEIDLRMTSDGDVLVTHDMISNRTTVNDGFNGKLNPVDVTVGLQRTVASKISPNSISSHPGSYWVNSKLKAYGRNAQLITNNSGALEDLSSFLYYLKKDGIVFKMEPSFLIILDIQDPNVFTAAIHTVKSYGLQGHVAFKFFANKAIKDNLSYNGADTCYQYMLQNGLGDPSLTIIPQINDGELDINEDDESGIRKWGHNFSVPEYLQCWADAKAQHSNVAYMSAVSASVPYDNINASNAAASALNWARYNHRKTMSIVPNPDAGRKPVSRSPSCNYYSFSSTNLAANNFPFAARTAKQNFANSQNVDYVITDVALDSAAFSGGLYYDLAGVEKILCQ